MKKTNGFSLLEVTIALVIMVGLIAIIIPVLRDEGNARRTDDLINQHAREYKMLYDAAGKWAVENKETMATATTVSIAISDLITAGFLPDDFAKRTSAGVVGEALIGGNYSLYARIDDLSGIGAAADQLRIAITEEGQYRPPLARKSGMTAAPGGTPYKEQSYGYNNRLMLAGQNQHKLIGGLLKSGSTTAIGLKGAFTADVGDFLTSSSARGRPLIFWGFPGLNPDANTGGGNDDEIPSQCNVHLPLGSDASCPAGWTMAAEWEACWPQLPDVIGVPALGTAVTVGTDAAPVATQCSGIACSTYFIQDMEVTRTFTINDSKVASISCATMRWHGNYYPWESSASPYYSLKPHGHGQYGKTSVDAVSTWRSSAGLSGCKKYDENTNNSLCLPGGVPEFLNRYNTSFKNRSEFFKAKICCQD